MAWAGNEIFMHMYNWINTAMNIVLVYRYGGLKVLHRIEAI